MTLDDLRLIRNILLRSFVIGVGLAVIFLILTFAGWQWWMPIATGLFHTQESTISPLVLGFFINLRFFLLFFLLTPALAIHWTIKKEQAKK